MPVFRQPDASVPSTAMENNNHLPPAPSAPLPFLTETRVEAVQSPVTEVPSARPIDREYLLNSSCFLYQFLMVMVFAVF